MALPNESPPPIPDAWISAFRDLVSGLLATPAARTHLRTFAERMLESLADDEASCSLADTTLLDIPVAPCRQPPVPEPVDVIPSAVAIKQLKWAQSVDSRIPCGDKPAAAVRAEPSCDATARSGSWRIVTDADLPPIPARCRIKAEACRWKLERRRLMDLGRRFADDIEPRDKDLICRAKALPDCFLWMNWQDGPALGAASSWDGLADSFEALAEAVGILPEVLCAADDLPDLFKEALCLAAEAQSAVRSAAREVGYDNEPEQDRTYNWLKRTAGERGHYISRYMRVDDPADPSQSRDLQQRLAAFRERLESRRGQEKLRRKRLGQLKYLSTQIQDDPGADHTYSWDKLISAVEELVQAGEPPSSKEIRRHLLPILDDLPAGDVSPQVELVLRELDRFLGENPGEEPCPIRESRPSPQVAEVAERLRGRSIVLIGGVRKPGHVEALKDAFQLKDVVWVPTREHQSVSKFEPYVRQPDVAVVVLAIRWTSHSYGDVKEFCDSYGKPFVRLKAGYNPSQVAAHILEQVSDKLPLPSAQSESA